MTRLIHFLLVVLACLTAAQAQAQTDPPGRVGRLSHLENNVEFRVDRNDQGGPATLNWPISNGAILSTGRGGKAEVWIGSTAYRLADNSEIEFAAVDDSQVAIRVNGGTLAVSILDRDQADDVTILTPEGRIRFATPGRYRIEVGDQRTELSVQAGQASIDDGSRATPVNAGEQANLSANHQLRIDRDGRPDNFDRRVAERENASLASTTRRHVSPYMTGYQDLDSYGDWQSVPEYGTVWYPNGLADDWAPYRYGRWAWVAPWGWTWIDQAPWGFAPFHYGRWAIIRGRWGWIPGNHASRPVYAPALVAWHGNPGWNVSFSFGSAPAVGWFPLGPREVYVPSYRYSPNHLRQLNITHIHDVTIINRESRPDARRNYAYRDQPRAVTVIPAEQLREGRPITAQSVRRNQRAELERAPQARPSQQGEWLKPAPDARRPRADFEPARREERFQQRPEAGDNLRRNRPDAAGRPAMPEQEARPAPVLRQDNARPDSPPREGRRDPALAPRGAEPGLMRNEPNLRPNEPRPEIPPREFRRDEPVRPMTPPEIRRESVPPAPRANDAPPMRGEAAPRPNEPRPEIPPREFRRDEPVRPMTPPEIRRENTPPAPRANDAPPMRGEAAPRPNEPRPEMPQREFRREEAVRPMMPRQPEPEIRRDLTPPRPLESSPPRAEPAFRAPEPRQEMPQREMRRDEPPRPMPAPETRREVREMPRFERPTNQEREAPMMRQREMPRNEPRPPEIRNEPRGDRQHQERKDNRDQH